MAGRLDTWSSQENAAYRPDMARDEIGRGAHGLTSPSELVHGRRLNAYKCDRTEVGRPGLDPGTLGLKVPCSTR
jgi:hypothetical protein